MTQKLAVAQKRPVLWTFELLMKLGWHPQTCLGVLKRLIRVFGLSVRFICFSNFNKTGLSYWFMVESKSAPHLLGVGLSSIGAGLIDNRRCFLNPLDNFGSIAGVGYIAVKALLQQGGRLGIA